MIWDSAGIDDGVLEHLRRRRDRHYLDMHVRRDDDVRSTGASVPLKWDESNNDTSKRVVARNESDLFAQTHRSLSEMTF